MAQFDGLRIPQGDEWRDLKGCGFPQGNEWCDLKGCGFRRVVNGAIWWGADSAGWQMARFGGLRVSAG